MIDFYPLPSPNPILSVEKAKDPPVFVPNTEVKLFSADGTAWATLWESRSPPISSFLFIEKPKAPIRVSLIGAFFCV